MFSPFPWAFPFRPHQWPRSAKHYQQTDLRQRQNWNLMASWAVVYIYTSGMKPINIWLLSSPDWLQIMHIRYTRYIKVDCANACRTQALQSNNIKSQNKWWKNASSVTIWTPTKLIYNKPCSNLFYEITPYRNAPKTNLGSGLFIAMAVSPSRASSDEIKTWASSHQDLTQHRWSTLQLTNKAMECPHFQ